MPIINGSDPGISRQSTTPTVARTSPPTVSSNGSSTSNGTSVARGIAPIVSGSDVSYPQATESTSTNSVTITSSVNNDSGDIVTVYTSPSTISVSAVNQTINQYTSVDSGVNQIVAGNGVTISSTGTNGTGIVTINSTGGSGNVGNIAVLNLDGNSANVLHGDGTWSADQTTYGNSNVAAYLPTYTGNVGAGNVNVTGTVYANGLSSTGLASLTTLNVSTTANLGAVGNVIITGGTNGQILTTNGNGVLSWATVSSGGLPLANGNSNINIATANGNATITTAGTQTWTFDTTGNLTIPGTITSNNTINIDNRASGNSADINLYSADDILIQARDRDAGSTAEGGDINIYAGDSAEDSDTSAGDIVIEAGAGGASNLDFGGGGGFVRIEAGAGGNAVGANISARSGGSLTLNAGNAGTNNGNIDLGNSGGDVTINAGDSTGNGSTGGSIFLVTGLAGANAEAGDLQIQVPSSDGGPGGTWRFDGSGILELPNSGTIGNDGNNIDIGSTSAISLEASSAVNIYTDTGSAAYQWQFQDDGNLRLPTIELDVGNTINEQTVIQSQRKIIPGLRYSAEINGTTPTVVYTATSVDTTSMKVAMQIQHTGLGFEFFDVSATSSGFDTYYSVSNRLHPPGITDSTVVVDFNGSNIMEITVTTTSGATTSWVTYDAVEFGIPQD